MNLCSHCQRPLQPTDDECAHCGSPVSRGEPVVPPPKRQTVIASSAAPSPGTPAPAPSPVFPPPSSSMGAPAGAGAGGAAPTPGWDPRDPFARALVGGAAAQPRPPGTPGAPAGLGTPMGGGAAAPAAAASPAPLPAPAPAPHESKRRTVIAEPSSGMLSPAAMNAPTIQTPSPFASTVQSPQAPAGGAGGMPGAPRVDHDPFRAAVAPAPVTGVSSTGAAGAAGAPAASLGIGGQPGRRIAGLLLTYSGDGWGRVFPFYEGKTVVGRAGDRGLDLELVDDRVSSPHCSIIARPSGLLLKDMGSTNGTHHRRADEAELKDVLDGMVQLRDRDVIKVGGTVFLVLLVEDGAMRALWPPPGGPRGQG